MSDKIPTITSLVQYATAQLVLIHKNQSLIFSRFPPLESSQANDLAKRMTKTWPKHRLRIF